MKRMGRRVLIFFLLFFLVINTLNAVSGISTAQTFILVTSDNSSDRGVYDMSNNRFLFKPSHTDSQGRSIPPTTINCDRDTNIYITFELDESFIPKCITEGNMYSYYGGNLASLPVKRVNVNYKTPQGQAKTEQMDLKLDRNAGVLFFKRHVDPKASWAADDSSDHDYDYHMDHLAKYPGIDPVTGQSSMAYACRICYPHTFWTTVPNYNDPVIKPTDGKTAGGKTEPWGQNPTGDVWIPNGAWYHDDHTDKNRSTSGNPGKIFPVGKTKRFAFSFVDVYVALKKYTASSGYQSFSLVNKFQLQQADAVYWQLAQCGDNCDPSTNGQVSAGGGLKPTSYDIAMGPSGNIYLYSPYMNPILQYIPAGQTNWQPYRWDDMGASGDGYHTINVNCNPDLSNLRHIGVATKNATTDWVYLASTDRFAVGDQFNGRGGVLYLANINPSTGMISKVYIRKDNSNAHNVTARRSTAPVYPNLGSLRSINLPNNIYDIAADGLGSLYYIQKAAAGGWKVDTTYPKGNWISASDLGFPNLEKRRVKLYQDFKQTVYIREYDYSSGYGTERLKTQKVAYTLTAGKRYSFGWEFRDPNNSQAGGLPSPTRDPSAPIIDSTNVDIATVVDASPPIEGEANVDITPVDTSIIVADNLDYIPVEDGQEYTWQFENYQTDYKCDGKDLNGNLVNNEIGTAVDMAPPNPGDPYENFNGEGNPLHFNFGNQSRGKDLNNNGFVGGYPSNALVDSACSSGNPTQNARDSREYRWRLILLSRDGKKFSPEVVEDTGWKPYSAQGYQFKHKFLGQGIYELQLQARYQTYDYGEAGIVPVFTADPDRYIDCNGGNGGGGVQGWNEPATASPPSRIENGGTPVHYYCKVATAPGGTGTITASNQAQFKKWTTAKRMIVVGQKVPDYGAWVAGKVYLFGEKQHLAKKYYSHGDWQLLGWAGTDFNGVRATITQNPDPIEIDEDHLVWFEPVFAVKYYKNVDEKTINDYRNATIGSQGENYDMDKQIHDLFSGVEPGSLTIQIDLYDGAGGEITYTLPAQETKLLIKKWSNTPLITQSDAAGIYSGVNFSFNTQAPSGMILAQINSLVDKVLALNGQGKQTLVSKNSQGQVIYQGEMENTLGTGNWDLSYIGASTGKSSSGKYVPDYASIGLFYLKVGDLNPSLNQEIDKSSPNGTKCGKTINMRYIADETIYDTPTVGRVNNNFAPDNCVKAKVKLFGNVIEWQPIPVDSNRSGEGGFGSPGYMTGPSNAVKTAFSFEALTHNNVLLLEIPINIKVKDTTPPSVSISFKDPSPTNPSTSPQTAEASTGDIFLQDIGIRVDDNNPFSMNLGNVSDPTLIGSNQPDAPNFSVSLAYSYVPKNYDFTPEINTDLKWVDLSSIIYNSLNHQPIKTIVFSQGASYNYSYSEVKGQIAEQFFTVPAKSIMIDPTGGLPFYPDSAPFTREPGDLVVVASASDLSGNGLWVNNGQAVIPDKDLNLENQLGADVNRFSNSISPSTNSLAISSYAQEKIEVKDNDPPEIYFAVSSPLANYALSIQYKDYNLPKTPPTALDTITHYNERVGKWVGLAEPSKFLVTSYLKNITNLPEFIEFFQNGTANFNKWGSLIDNIDSNGNIIPGNFGQTSPNGNDRGVIFVSAYRGIAVYTPEVMGVDSSGNFTNEVNFKYYVQYFPVVENSRFTITLRTFDNCNGSLSLTDANCSFERVSGVENIVSESSHFRPKLIRTLANGEKIYSYSKMYSTHGAVGDVGIWRLRIRDYQGNERSIVIPIKVVRTNFRVQTLERKNTQMDLER